MHHRCGVCHRQAGLERLDARLELSNLVILLLARTARPRHQRPTRGADGAVEVRVIKTASTGWAGGRTLKQLGDGGDGLLALRGNLLAGLPHLEGALLNLGERGVIFAETLRGESNPGQARRGSGAGSHELVGG